MKRSLRPDRHNRALAAIGHALTLQDQPQAWCGLSLVLRARLSPYERACLLAAAAEASDTDPLIDVIETIVPARLAGAPLPVFSEIEGDARWWADMATLPEIRAWLAACFVRLPVREKLAFLEHAARRLAA